MDADLTEIALNALEAAEAEDNKGDDTGDDESGQEPDNNNRGGEDNPDKKPDNDDSEDEDDEEDDSSDSDDGDDDEEDDSEDDNESDDDSDDDDDDSDSDDDKDDAKKPEQKPAKKKKNDEMSDEEFEELAKKRGYAKQQSEDDKKQAEEKAKAEKEQLERLTRKPREIPDDVWADTPTNNKIVYNQLPIITARGANGQNVNVKLPNQLPPNFQFADEAARQEFVAAIQQQTNTMNQLLGALNARDERAKQEASRKNEAQMVVDEVARLQKAGSLPSPKAKYGDANFDNDPAVKVINNVLAYRIQRAQQGVNLSVEDALKLYKADHPEEFKAAAEKKGSTKAKGDEERKKIAKKISGSKKSTGKSASDKGKGEHKYYHYGLSTQDVLDRALEDLD